MKVLAIADSSVVPHQLLVALTIIGLTMFSVLAWKLLLAIAMFIVSWLSGVSSWLVAVRPIPTALFEMILLQITLG